MRRKGAATTTTIEKSKPGHRLGCIECGKLPRRSHGLCNAHYIWKKRRGLLPRINYSASMDYEAWFWDQVDKSGGDDECWGWQRNKLQKGYGVVSTGGQTKDTAHRVAYRLSYGEIPEGLHVLHSCDNPPCVNPKHLRAGTRQDNVDDMVERGRGWWQRES